jgi:hypothetical protein
VQVRSLSKVDAVGLGGTLDGIVADYWIVLNNVVAEKPVAFILSSDEVRERVNRNEKDGRSSYWLEIRDYNQARFRENWERLALFPSTESSNDVADAAPLVGQI